MLRLIDGLHARVEFMQADDDADTQGNSRQQSLQKDFQRWLRDRGGPRCHFLQLHRRISQLLGHVDLLDPGKNRLVEGPIALKFSFQIVVLDGLASHFKKSLLRSLALQLGRGFLSQQACAN